MNKGQGLPITTVILVIIAVVVVTVFIIYMLTTSGKGFDITQTYWSGTGNMTKNASAQAGSSPPGGGTRTCSDFGGPCNTFADCCNNNYLCYPKTYSKYPNEKTCNKPATGGEFCDSNLNCLSGVCTNLLNGKPKAGSQCS